MTFTVARKPLLAELTLLQSVLEGKTTIPILSFVKFGLVGSTLTLTASNLDVSITTELEAEGDAWGGCLPSAQLYNLVKLLDAKTAETITFTPKDGPMQVRAGKSKHLLPVAKAEDFPEIDCAEIKGIAIDAATFNEMLSSVSFAALVASDGINQSQQRYTGVSLLAGNGQLSLTATNVARMATTSCAVETPITMDVIIPRQAVGALLGIKEGELTIGVTSDGALQFSNGQRQMYVRRLVDEKFVDWRSMFPKSYEHTAELAVSDLGAAIKRAMLTQNERRNMVIDGLRWTWANGELLIETRGGDKGKSDETVEITCPSLNGASIALGMNGQQVIDALGLLGEKVMCRFSDGTSIVELAPQQSAINFVYYINTVSLKNWQ